MKTMIASTYDSPRKRKTLRLIPIAGARKKVSDDGGNGLGRAEEQIEKPLEWLDGMDEDEATGIMNVYLKGCFSEPYRLGETKNEGRYFVSEVQSLEGRPMVRLIVDKQSGHIISIPNPLLGGHRKSCARSA